MSDVDIKYKRDGVNLVLKQTVQDRVLTPKDILINIKALESEIEKAKQQLIKFDEAIIGTKESIEKNKERLKGLIKYKEESTNVQEALARKLYEDKKDILIKEVKESYKEDMALTPDQNKRQMFAQFQRRLATDSEVAEKLSPDIIKDMYFNNCFFDNPFK